MPHCTLWLKNMTIAFDSDDFLESITAVVVGTWGAREMARVLTELPHNHNCLAGVLCAVDHVRVLAPNSLPGSSTHIMPTLCALLVLIVVFVTACHTRHFDLFATLALHQSTTRKN